MTGLWGTPCGCPDTAEIVAAELNGEPRRLCKTHDAATIRAQKVDAERSEIRGRIDRTTQIIEDHRAGNELAAARARATARQTALDRLATTDSLLANLTAITGAHLPLGLPPSAYPALAGFTPADDPSHGTPFDAA